MSHARLIDPVSVDATRSGFLRCAWRSAGAQRWPFVVSFAWLFLYGCGAAPDQRPKVYPVNGQILFDGQPLPNAFVVLHFKGVGAGNNPTSRGTTDSSGNFQLTTFEANDGAPQGEYAVTVTYHALLQVGGSFEPSQNLLPSVISEPSTTDIFVRVADAPTNLQPINVRR